jgi:hypothetical protein
MGLVPPSTVSCRTHARSGGREDACGSSKKGRTFRPDPSSFVWWPETDLNRRHGDFQSPALPTELPGRAQRLVRIPARPRDGQGQQRATRHSRGRGATRMGRAPKALHGPPELLLAVRHEDQDRRVLWNDCAGVRSLSDDLVGRLAGAAPLHHDGLEPLVLERRLGRARGLPYYA